MKKIGEGSHSDLNDMAAHIRVYQPIEDHDHCVRAASSIGFLPANLQELSSFRSYTPLVSLLMQKMKHDFLPSNATLIASGLVDTLFVYMYLTLLIGLVISSHKSSLTKSTPTSNPPSTQTNGNTSYGSCFHLSGSSSSALQWPIS